MGLRELSDVLWRERQLLDLLGFKLEAEKMVDGSGTRWAALAMREINEVRDRLRIVEVERATLSADVALDLGLSPLASLRELAASSPEPWSGILQRHWQALSTTTAGLSRAAADSQDRLRHRLDGARRTLDLRGTAEESV